MTRHSTSILRALRQARWRRWLVAAALVCVVGVFSIALTHHHKSEKAELSCPVCQVLAHGIPAPAKPNLAPALKNASWYRHTLPQWAFSPFVRRYSLKPQPRAPPVSTASLV